MGDRVAVMRKGVLQQVDTPQTLYEQPVNLFVAGFIGSPAMNLVHARVAPWDGSLAVEVGGFHLPVPPEVMHARPALRSYEGQTVILGIRPEDMEDASLVSDAPAERRIRSTVELREALGSDVLVHFSLDAAPAVTEDVVELAADAGREPAEVMKATDGTDSSNIIARLNPRTRAHNGDQIELEVDTARLHFFAPDDGSAIGGET